MYRRALLILALAVIWIDRADASLLVTMSSPDDLMSISIGQSVTVSINLDGIDTGQELDALGVTTVFDGALFGVPSVASGPIVPDPLHDPLDFLIAEGVGFAEAAFLTLGPMSEHHITENGNFFSFELSAVSAGQGEFRIDFSGATLFNDVNPSDPIPIVVDDGPHLPFTIVPEPKCAVFGLLTLVAFLTGVHRNT